jgi:4-amino-4-deoxy-L-arabinose transferase-like glycosyltransferase
MKSHVRIVVILCIVAVIFRIGFLLAFGGFDNEIHDSMADQGTYLDIAHNLAAGKGFVTTGNTWLADPGKPTSIMPPLYPVYLALMFNVFGDNLVPIRLMNVLLSLVTLVVIYTLGVRLFNRRVAILSAALWAVYPLSVMYVRPLVSEALFLPLVALSVLITHFLSKGSPKWWLIVAWGVVMGLAILTRTEAGILGAMLLLWLIVRRFQEKDSLVRVAATVLVPGFIVLLVMLPYGFYNRSAHGAFSLFPNAKWKFWDQTWLAANRDLPEYQIVRPELTIVPDWEGKTETERDNYLWNMAIQFVRENPVTFAKQRFQRLIFSYPLLPREEFAPPIGMKGEFTQPDGYEFGVTSLDDFIHFLTPAERIRVWIFRVLFVLALVGTVLIIRRRNQDAYLLLLVIVWNMIHSMLFVGSERLRSQIDPYLILLAAYTLEWVWIKIEGRRKNPSPTLTPQTDPGAG